jgi:hypothetical protein
LRNRRQIVSSGGKIDVVLMGDSITHFMERPEPKYGGAAYASFTNRYSVLNCGYAGDDTRNLLWRAMYGELDGYSAKTVVIMIGTNNPHMQGYRGPSDTAAGIARIVETVRRKQPGAKVLCRAIWQMPVAEPGSSGPARYRVLREAEDRIPRFIHHHIAFIHIRDKPQPLLLVVHMKKRPPNLRKMAVCNIFRTPERIYPGIGMLLHRKIFRLIILRFQSPDISPDIGKSVDDFSLFIHENSAFFRVLGAGCPVVKGMESIRHGSKTRRTIYIRDIGRYNTLAFR